LQLNWKSRIYKRIEPNKVASIIPITILWNQIITKSFILKGISVDSIQGIDAEKNNIDDIDINKSIIYNK